jgi:hypothetical protein
MGMVEPYSSMIAGPSTTAPASSAARWRIGVSCRSSKCTFLVAATGSTFWYGLRRMAGRVIGPMPETRKLTHSTPWRSSSR